MAELKKMKTAIVGCGAISNIYCKNLKNMYQVIDLVAVCDIFPEAAKARAEQFGIERVMTMEELCADPEIELVVNLTGPAQHYEVVSQLLKAGKTFTRRNPWPQPLSRRKSWLPWRRRTRWPWAAPRTPFSARPSRRRSTISTRA